jgi:hypothetical protein
MGVDVAAEFADQVRDGVFMQIALVSHLPRFRRSHLCATISPPSQLMMLTRIICSSG